MSLIRNDPNFTVEGPYPAWPSHTMWLNTQREPLGDKIVRQALSYAVPYKDLIEVGASGFASQSYASAPAGVFPHDPSVFQYSLDIAKAKELLAQAGRPDGGFSMELTITSQNGAQVRYAPLIKESFAEIGVDLTITSMLFNQQYDRARSTDPAARQDAYIQQYAPTYADAGVDNLYSFFHCEDEPFTNFSYWCNPEYDELLAEAAQLTATDRPAAQEIYTQAMSLLVEEAPAIFLYDLQRTPVTPKAIGGFVYNLNYPNAPYYWYDLFPAN
jgi:peptide/nickel transport system substrate-binding protein